jgi:hypothetical protein
MFSHTGSHSAPRATPSDAGIRFGGDLACTTLFMQVAAVQARMQDDDAAFGGWSVVLLSWCGVRRIVIDWDEPADVRNGHYQRFRYRLGHLEALLGPEIIGVKCTKSSSVKLTAPLCYCVLSKCFLDFRCLSHLLAGFPRFSDVFH